MTCIGDNTTFTACVHMNQSMHMDYFFYPLSYDMKFKLNIQDLIHVNASHHTWSKCLTSHMLVEKLIVRKCFILKIAAMNKFVQVIRFICWKSLESKLIKQNVPLFHIKLFFERPCTYKIGVVSIARIAIREAWKNCKLLKNSNQQTKKESYIMVSV